MKLIKNKKESFNYLKQNKLNHIDSTEAFIPNVIFKVVSEVFGDANYSDKYETMKIISEFINKYDKISIRELPLTPGGPSKFMHNIINDNVLPIIHQNYNGKQIQLVRSNKYEDDNHLLMQAELLIDSNMNINAQIATKRRTFREGMANPQYKIVNASLLDNSFYKQFIRQGTVSVTNYGEFLSLSNRSKREGQQVFRRKLYENNIKKLSDINKIIDYYFKHNLFGNILECTLYNTPVGVNQEELLIWEIRGSY